MIERERNDVSDGVSWYCPQCYTRKSIRQNSFFAKSRLPLKKWVLLIYFWVRQYPVTDAHEEAEVGEHTAISGCVKCTLKNYSEIHNCADR